MERVLGFIRQLGAERNLVLLLISGNSVACTNATRTVPDHIIIPGTFEHIARCAHSGVDRKQTIEHIIYNLKRLRRLFLGSVFKH